MFEWFSRWFSRPEVYRQTVTNGVQNPVIPCRFNPIPREGEEVVGKDRIYRVIRVQHHVNGRTRKVIVMLEPVSH